MFHDPLISCIRSKFVRVLSLILIVTSLEAIPNALSLGSSHTKQEPVVQAEGGVVQ